MKKSIFLLSLLFLIGSFTLTAQRSSLFIGATGGGNLSKFKYTNDLSVLYPETSQVFGVNGGMTFGMEIQNFTLSSGIQYIQKGSKYETENFEDEVGVGFFTAKEKLHFVSVPLLLGYRKYLTDNFAIGVAIGPSFNFGVGGKLEEEIEYFGSEDVETSNYKIKFGNSVNDDYQSMQIGFQFSPSLIFAINDETKLTFNVTWDSGLGDSFNKRYKNANSFFDDYKGDQMNRSTIFSIGYERHFSLGDRY